MDSRDTAEWIHNKFWPLRWRVSFSIRLQTTLNVSRESTTFWPLWWRVSWVHNILTTVMTRIVVDKSTDHTKPQSICFLPRYQLIKEMFFFQSSSWKRRCVTNWKRQRCLDSYRKRQIGQWDCQISSDCGKIPLDCYFLHWKFSKFKVPISSKFLFSYLILYITQWTSAKEKIDLDKM